MSNICFHLCDCYKLIIHPVSVFTNLWPFHGNQNVDVALGENEFHTAVLDHSEMSCAKLFKGSVHLVSLNMKK